MLGMSPKKVRHYGKRARALMIAKTAGESVRSGTLIQLVVKSSGEGGLNCGSAAYQYPRISARGDPNGTRTRVFAVKGRRPRPLDDGAAAAAGRP